MAATGRRSLTGLVCSNPACGFNIRLTNGEISFVARSAELQISLDAVRAPAVSGRSTGTRDELDARCGSCSTPWRGAPRPARAAVAPHAGYLYSGLTRGAVFARLEIRHRRDPGAQSHRVTGRPRCVRCGGGARSGRRSGDVCVDDGFARALARDLAGWWPRHAACLRARGGGRAAFLAPASRRPDRAARLAWDRVGGIRGWARHMADSCALADRVAAARVGAI